MRYLLSLFVCALFLSGCTARIPWVDRFGPHLGIGGPTHAPASTTDRNAVSASKNETKTGDPKAVPASYSETASLDRF